MGRARPSIRPDDLKLLGRSDLFAGWSANRRAQLLEAGKVVTVPAQTVLWRRGTWPKYAFIVLSGRIGLIDAADESGTVVDLFLPGAAIGGALALKNGSYLFSGMALDDVRALRVPLTVYRRWLLADQELLVATVLQVMEQWRTLTQAVRDLKQLSINQRLGHYLLTLAPRSRGPATIRLTDDLDLMARILGVTRESLSRSFAQLRQLGVRKRAKLVTIAEPQRLRAFCDSLSRRQGRP